MHTTCLKPVLQNIPLGPWYCAKCVKEIDQMEKKDITLDFNVISYLSEGILPEESVERNRVIRRASNYVL